MDRNNPTRFYGLGTDFRQQVFSLSVSVSIGAAFLILCSFLTPFNTLDPDIKGSNALPADQNILLPNYAYTGSGASIEITKAAQFVDADNDGFAGIGDSIVYTLKVTNCGTDTLTNIYIIDPLVSNMAMVFEPMLSTGSGYLLSGSGSICFAPGDMTTLQFGYPLTNSGLVAGIITNQATVFAESKEDGMMISDPSDDPSPAASDMNPNTPTITPLRVYRCDPSATRSLSCPQSINLAFGPDCRAVLDPSGFSRDNDVPMIVKMYDGEGNEIDTLRRHHVGKHLEYHAIDTCSGAFCWGLINLEIKLEPMLVVNYDTIMCGDNLPPIPSLKEIKAQLDSSCYRTVFDLSEYYTTDGKVCDTIITVRQVNGKILDHGQLKNIQLRIDSIFEIPIDTSMIVCPFGSDISDALVLECSSLTEYPSPEYIAKHYDIRRAFPYIDKGLREQIIINHTDTVTSYIEPQTIYKDGVWVTVNVTVYDTLKAYDTIYVTAPFYQPLKPGAFCNLSIRYSDEKFATCTGPETKILRKWWLIDWCTGKIKTCQHWIVIKDTKAPVIKMVQRDSVGTKPWLCVADYRPMAMVSDSCSGYFIEWSSSSGTVGADGWIRDIKQTDSPVEIILTATDSCGNVSKDTLELILIDVSGPVAIAKDELNVNLVRVPDTTDNSSVAKVFVESIDKGSHDSGCSEISKCILLDAELKDPIINPGSGEQERDTLGNLLYHAHQCHIDGILKRQIINKKDTQYIEIPYVICKEYVKFCCENLGPNKVALVVDDSSPYSPSSISWSIVKVEDKNAPYVICPEPITVQCGEDYEIPKPKIYGTSCSGADLSYSLTEKIDQCGEGQILVKWTLNQQLICESIINVKSKYSFDPKSIKWPLHRDGGIEEGLLRECQIIGKDKDGKNIYGIVEVISDVEMLDPISCSGVPVDKPVWCLTDCGLIVSSYDDLEVEAGPSCKKIIRRWTVIDWCSWAPNSFNYEAGESFKAVDDTWLDRTRCPGCEKTSSEDRLKYFRYDSVHVDGYYRFDQLIKIEDKTAPVIEVAQLYNVEIFTGANYKNDDFNECLGTALISAKALDYCNDSLFDASSLSWHIETRTLSGKLLGSAKFASGATAVVRTASGKPGEQSLIIWRAKDACGNESRDTTLVKYIDKKSPVPVCKSTLSVGALDPLTKTVQIWAKDFDQGSFDNCGDVALYFKNKNGLATPSLSFSCEDIPNGVSAKIELKLYVGDESGNENFCIISLRIDDSGDVCPDQDLGSAIIAGALHTSKGDMIEKAEVLLNIEQRASLTGLDGSYIFEDLASSSKYEVAPSKNDDFLNGVSTLDLVLIQRHILGIDIFDDPYEVVAADVSNDRRISAIDLVQLRQLILGITDEFPANSSWRFVDADQEFTNALIPYPLKEVIAYDILASSKFNQDFVGIKIGDVSGNAIANSGLISGTRSQENMNLRLVNSWLESGQEYTIDVNVGNPSQLIAMQMTLNTKDLDILNLQSAEMSLSPSQYSRLSPDKFTMAWHSPVGISVEKRAFSILVRANKSQWLEEALEMSELPTASEAYSEEGKRYGLNIDWIDTGERTASLVELYQNEPNPFAGSTLISFYLSERMPVRLGINDITGKEIYSENKEYGAGTHRIQLSDKTLPGNGVYYYRLDAGGRSQVKKMILLK